jgi:hypothetical protein
MKAMTAARYGGPETMQLEEVPTPTIGDGEVLVAVRATSLQALDWHLLRADPAVVRLGEGLFRPKRTIHGVDIAGIIDAVGASVDDLGPGDEGLRLERPRRRAGRILPRQPSRLTPDWPHVSKRLPYRSAISGRGNVTGFGRCRPAWLPQIVVPDPAIDLDENLGGRKPIAATLVSCRGMRLDWEQAVIDAQDPVALGRWWLEALRWVVVNDDPDEFEIRPRADQIPGLIFAPVAEAKQTKNRLHLDFRPDDQEAEVERLIGRGARRVDVGQGDASWVVLADPEGNEFCVLRSRPAG